MKILVISGNSFSDVHNNGKTLKAMFSEFRPEELCMLFFRPRGEVSYSACHDYYLLSDKDILKSIFKPWASTGRIITLDNNKRLEKEISTQEPHIKRTVFRQQTRELVWKVGHWNTPRLRRWIDNQKPQAIFLVGGYGRFASHIATSLHKTLNIPLSVYYTDDYVINDIPSRYRNSLLKSYVKTIAESSLCYAIGDDMAKVYTEFFGKSFRPIMNIVDKVDPYPNTASDKVRISYFGSLYYHRLEAIVRFAGLLNERNSLITKQWEINVYTSSQLSVEQKTQFQKMGIINKGFVIGEEYKKAMQNTDIFLHVESDDEEYKRLVMLSVSTKIPEYLMAYRPTIAFGPKEVASIRLFEKIDHRMVVWSNDEVKKDGMLNNIVNMINDCCLREELSRIGYNYAIEHFSREVVAKKFKEELEEVVEI